MRSAATQNAILTGSIPRQLILFFLHVGASRSVILSVQRHAPEIIRRTLFAVYIITYIFLKIKTNGKHKGGIFMF